MGLAASLAHPGGNVTGSTFFLRELMAKRLELLKEILPSMSSAGALCPARRRIDAEHPRSDAAPPRRRLASTCRRSKYRSRSEFESAFASWAERKVGGGRRCRHAQFAEPSNRRDRRDRRQASLSLRSGRLNWRRRAGSSATASTFPRCSVAPPYFVDKILKGAKPGDIPIEQRDEVQNVVNLKTAKALGIDIPPTLLAAADEVIE